MKKCMVFILTLICAFNSFPLASFAETETVASAELITESPELVNIKEVVYGVGKTPKTETAGDVSDVWTLDNTDNEAYYIGVDIDDSFANQIKDGSVFDIEIDYYSRGNGFFRVIYDSQKKAERGCDVVLTKNTNTWKTEKITVDDGCFNNRVKGKFDFIITIESPRYYQKQISAASVPVKAIRVTRHAAQNIITHYGYTNETGNVFPYWAEKTLYNEFTNTLRRAIAAEVTYRAVDSDGVEQWKKTEKLTFAGKKTTTVSVNVETQHCGLYTLYVNIASDNPKINQEFKRYNFAIVKTDPHGIKNENYYLTTHFEHYGSNVDAGLDVIAKSNTYGVRAGFGWTNVYDSSDRSNNIYKDEDKVFHSKLRKNDLHLMATYGFSVTAETGGWKYLPKTEEALKSWTQAIEFVTKNTKDLVERIEIWNEPNILDFNGGVGYSGEVDSYYGVKEPPEVYAAAAKVAAAGAKKGNPDVKVGVMSLVNLGSTAKVNEKTLNFFKTAMLNCGLENYCDAVTFHPYSDGSAEHYHNIGEVEKGYMSTLSNKETLSVWNTEYGFSTADQASPTEQRQANNMVRTPIHMMGEGVGDVNVGYNFAQKGLVPTNREDNFGIVSPGFDGGADKYDKNFVPRLAYIAVTAMNYYLAQAAPDGNGNYGSDKPADAKNDFDSEHIYKFKSKKLDADIYAIWRTEQETEKEFNLGAKSVIYADMYGNEEIVTSENGIYKFKLGIRPAYIIVKNQDDIFNVSGVSLMNRVDGEWKKGDIELMKQADSVKAVVSGYSPDDEERSVMLVMAYYKEDENGSMLVDIETTDLKLAGSGFITGQKSFSVSSAEDYNVCKCFVWDKNSFIPYVKNAIIN